MPERIELQTILEGIMGTRNVYFQPPSNFQLGFPCIVFSLSDVDIKFAGNRLYSKKMEYTLTLMDKNPDTLFLDKLLELPLCQLDRAFISDNIYHYVFRIFF